MIMKKIFVLAVCMTLVFCLSGCGFIQFMPSADEIGESKTFEKDGIKLLLTDAYEEQVSEVGFYGYYVADFGAVMVERTTFKEHPECEGMTLDQFAEAYRNDNGHSMAIEHDDELIYYVFIRISAGSALFAQRPHPESAAVRESVPILRSAGAMRSAHSHR